MTRVETADVDGTEVELTAEELRALAPSQVEAKVDAPASVRQPDTATNGVAEWAKSLRSPVASARTKRSRVPALPLFVTVVSLIAISVVAVSKHDDQAKVPVQTKSWNPAPDAASEPVLVENPFDEQEVFEFPAGTTESAARQAVADRLLERARQRRTP